MAVVHVQLDVQVHSYKVFSTALEIRDIFADVLYKSVSCLLECYCSLWKPFFLSLLLVFCPHFSL